MLLFQFFVYFVILTLRLQNPISATSSEFNWWKRKLKIPKTLIAATKEEKEEEKEKRPECDKAQHQDFPQPTSTDSTPIHTEEDHYGIVSAVMVIHNSLNLSSSSNSLFSKHYPDPNHTLKVHLSRFMSNSTTTILLVMVVETKEKTSRRNFRGESRKNIVFARKWWFFFRNNSDENDNDVCHTILLFR